MKYHEYVLLSAMESCPRGRRSMIGNHVGGKHCLKGSNPLLSVSYLQTGPLVKRLRHRPFTAVTRVRIPYGSLKFNWGFSSAGRASALQAEGHRFEPYRSHIIWRDSSAG